MIELSQTLATLARAFLGPPRRRRRGIRIRSYGPFAPRRWTPDLERSLRQRLARSSFVAVCSLIVAVAAPFTALAFVDETEAPPQLVFDTPSNHLDRQVYVDDVINISVAQGAALTDSGALSDAGPEVNPLLPVDANGLGELAPREPSVPEPGFGVFRQATPTPEPPPPPPPVEAPVEADAGQAAIGRFPNVSLTFYSCLGEGFCGNMANGEPVYQGAVACSFDLPLGTRLRIVGDPTNRVYVCKDRGLLTPTWIDVFWYDPADGWAWQAAVGRYGTIEIISLP